MSETQLAKYEAWIRRLEGLQEKDARRKPLFFRIFLALPVVGLVGFAWNTWFGVACVFTGVLMMAFGFYTFQMNQGDYERELSSLRRHAKKLRDEEKRSG